MNSFHYFHAYLCNYRVMWHHIMAFRWQYTSTHHFMFIKQMRFGSCCHGIDASSHLLPMPCTVPPSLVYQSITISMFMLSCLSAACSMQSFGCVIISEIYLSLFFWVSDTCYQWVLCLNAFDHPSRQSSIKACIFSTSALKILEAPTADICAEKAMYWGQVWAAFFHHYHSLIRMEESSSQLILMNRSCAVLNVTCCS